MKSKKEKRLESDKDLVVSLAMGSEERLLVLPGYLRFKDKDGNWITFPEMLNLEESVSFPKNQRKTAQKVINHYQAWIEGRDV